MSNITDEYVTKRQVLDALENLPWYIEDDFFSAIDRAARTIASLPGTPSPQDRRAYRVRTKERIIKGENPMTVGEMTKFLNQYPENAVVTMVSLNQDNPIEEDIGIKDILAIYSTDGGIQIVIRPEE